ncbi:MAG: ABC transporter ATP-binding protein [Blautia sp.]|nr:ABC transporter ATP-binding protein [Blautia sp.]
MDIITVNGFEKSYGDFKAVKGISFKVKEGSLFAFLGPNGAGKSTTIDTLCTLLACQKGDIRIAGYQLGKDDKKIRESIGVVFQQSLLDGSLSVKENLLLRGSFYNLSSAEVKSRVNEVAHFTGLDSFLNKKYGRLSGGQVRRADIARALINRPKLLFLDEPMTGLDPKTREDIWNMLFTMKNEMGMTIFLTTHYMEEAANADDVVIIKKGELVEEGTPAYLKDKYTEDHFIAYGYDAALKAQLEQAGRKVVEKNDELWIRVDGKEDVLAMIAAIKDRIGNFEVRMGTMDEMFINIVGEEEVKG